MFSVANVLQYQFTVIVTYQGSFCQVCIWCSLTAVCFVDKLPLRPGGGASGRESHGGGAQDGAGRQVRAKSGS